MLNKIETKVDNRDPYKAVWVSHSSMGDFLKCPRLYYLHNVYKNKNCGSKMINKIFPKDYLEQIVYFSNKISSLKQRSQLYFLHNNIFIKILYQS